MTDLNTPTPSNSVVTEAMIEAGVEAYIDTPDFLDDAALVEAIYLAMQSASTTGSDELVERVARALFKNVYGYALGDDQGWLERFKEHARAALNAIATPDTDRVKPSEIARDRADWLLDAVATATQDRRYLRGDPEYDEVAGEAILLNGEKAILVALHRAALSQPLGSQENSHGR